MSKKPSTPLSPQQDAAMQCLAYLQQVGRDYVSTLRPSAAGPTGEEIDTALNGLRNFVLQAGLAAPPPSVATAAAATHDTPDAETGM